MTTPINENNYKENILSIIESLYSEEMKNDELFTSICTEVFHAVDFGSQPIETDEPHKHPIFDIVDRHMEATFKEEKDKIVEACDRYCKWIDENIYGSDLWKYSSKKENKTLPLNADSSKTVRKIIRLLKKSGLSELKFRLQQESRFQRVNKIFEEYGSEKPVNRELSQKAAYMLESKEIYKQPFSSRPEMLRDMNITSSEEFDIPEESFSLRMSEEFANKL